MEKPQHQGLEQWESLSLPGVEFELVPPNKTLQAFGPRVDRIAWLAKGHDVSRVSLSMLMIPDPQLMDDLTQEPHADDK